MTSIRFGISNLPPEEVEESVFLDGLVDKGHRALELPFVTGFPWKEKRCRTFGELAAERDIRLSIHAPYFAVLTVEEEEKGAQCLAALEHTMKLGKALGAPVIVAHLGNTHGEDPAILMDRRDFFTIRRPCESNGGIYPLIIQSNRFARINAPLVKAVTQIANGSNA